MRVGDPSPIHTTLTADPHPGSKAARRKVGRLFDSERWCPRSLSAVVPPCAPEGAVCLLAIPRGVGDSCMGLVLPMALYLPW